MAGGHWREADLRFFVRKKDSKDGLHSYCRECAARKFREKYYFAVDKAAWVARRKAGELRRKLPLYGYDEPMPVGENMAEPDPKLFGDGAWPEGFDDAMEETLHGRPRQGRF